MVATVTSGEVTGNSTDQRDNEAEPADAPFTASDLGVPHGEYELDLDSR